MALDYLDVQPHQTRLMNKHRTISTGTRRIQYITRHHVAGLMTAAEGWVLWQTRPASAHYWVNPDGQITQMVWDNNIAWSNGNSASNAVSLSIEHVNSTGAPGWDISDTVITAGARWAAALLLFYGLGRPEFGRNVRDHREFSSTSCPFHLANGGKYHRAWMLECEAHYDRLLAEKNGDPAPTPEPEPSPVPVPEPTPEDDMNVSDLQAQVDRIEKQNARIERKVDLVLDQLVGPERDENGLPLNTGWIQLDNRTVVDFLATEGERLGIEGCVAIDCHDHGDEETLRGCCDVDSGPGDDSPGEADTAVHLNVRDQSDIRDGLARANAAYADYTGKRRAD